MIVIRHGFISARQPASRVAGMSRAAAAVGRSIAHLKYLQHRPGQDKEPGGRQLFDENNDRLDPDALREAIRELGNSKAVIHKITLAPEVDPKDKKAFTREVMGQLARDKGQDLTWVAVEHNNTDHHHIHVILLGKDKAGKEVRIDKSDYPGIKDDGDRFLCRFQPLEMWRAMVERTRKEQERQKTIEREKAERIRDGLELPWMNRKVLRELYEPYEVWAKKQKTPEKDKEREHGPAPGQEPERPLDIIKAAGKDWSRQNTLGELTELNKHLWDNQGDRIDKDEYKKLISWIREKEELGKRKPELEPGKDRDKDKDKDKGKTRKPDKKDKKGKDKSQESERDEFKYHGQKYSKDTPYEKLSDLANTLRNPKAERLPVNEYQKLRGWIENADRQRWAKYVDKQVDMYQERFTREQQQKSADHNLRAPMTELQQKLAANPVVGIVTGVAGAIKTVLDWIPLIDRTDHVFKAGKNLQSDKLDLEQKHIKGDRTDEQKDRDRKALDKLDQAIEDNEYLQDKKDKEKKYKMRDKGREAPVDLWGRW